MSNLENFFAALIEISKGVSGAKDKRYPLQPATIINHCGCIFIKPLFKYWNIDCIVLSIDKIQGEIWLEDDKLALSISQYLTIKQNFIKE